MESVVDFFIDMILGFANLLDSVVFSFAGISFTWLTILLSFTALCLIISVFWKGVRK